MDPQSEPPPNEADKEEERCSICSLSFSVGEKVNAKTEKDLFDCCNLIHYKCLMSKYANDNAELEKQKALYKLEKTISHIYLLDGGYSQFFYEDKTMFELPNTERIKQL